MNVKEIVFSVFGMALKIVAAVLIVMYTYKYALLAYDYGYRIFGETPITSGEGRTVTVTIKEGTDAKAVGEILENKGLIRDGELFVLQELISDYHGDILPGTYELNTSMTAEQMLEIMATVPESEEEDDNKKSLSEVAEEVSEEVLEEMAEEVIVGSESD